MVNLSVTAVKSVVFIKVLDSIGDLFLSGQLSAGMFPRFRVSFVIWLALSCTFACSNHFLNTSNDHVCNRSTWLSYHIHNTFVSWVWWYLGPLTSFWGMLIRKWLRHLAQFESVCDYIRHWCSTRWLCSLCLRYFIIWGTSHCLESSYNGIRYGLTWCKNALIL